jgi:PAS domain S-box-containing protein
MSVVFNAYLIASAFGVVALLVLAAAIWRRRPGPGVVPFIVLLAGIIEWTLANAAQLISATLVSKLFFSAIVYAGITTAPAAWLAFTLEYTGRERWLTRRNIALLLIEPVLTIGVAATNGLHHVFWSVQTLGPAGQLTSVFGPAFWVHATYSYVLLLVGTAFLVQAFIRSPQVYRGQVIWLLFGSVTPWFANALYIFGFSPLPDYLDLTPLAFIVTGLSVGWSLYRYRLMDIVPIARDRIVEGIGDAVFVFGRGNRVVDANPAALGLLGQPADAVIGQPADTVLAGQSSLVEKYRDVEQAQAEIAFEVNGQKREFNITLSPLRSRQGDLAGRVLVMHDITALKQVNRELALARQKAEEANELKTQFLATMSHELRTPLNAISGFTEIMLEGMAGELTDLQRGNLQRVLSNARDLRSLIDNLLDLAKIEAGRTELIQKTFNVREWLAQLVDQTRSLADEKGLKYEATLSPDVPADIEGDPSRLKQIALNLISNAIKFTEKGEVRVNIQLQEPDHWLIAVSDTGIGIPPHMQEVIFDKFRQADGSFTRKHGGSGLGLSIVRDLALIMGGGVRVRSEVGKGSTFTVVLPLKVPQAAAPAHQPEPVEKATNG